MNRKIELKVQLQGRQVEIIENMPMDDLYAIIDGLEEDFRHFEKIGSGSFGYVYGYGDFAIKIFKEEGNELNRDIGVLKDIGHLDCIPTLYAVIDDSIIIMERIHGKTVRQYCYGDDNNNEYGIDDNFIEKWENALLEVIKAGYSPDDLHESNVMIDSKTREPKLVDVGWFFKHESNYDNFDIHKMKTDYGYSRANTWTGDALKGYVRREKRRLEKEAQKLIEKYNMAHVV